MHRISLLLLSLAVLPGATSPASAQDIGPAAARMASSTACPGPCSRADGARPAADFHAAYDALLAEVVTADGRVRYAGLRGPLRSKLDALVAYVERADPPDASDAERTAFWVNAYNVLMLRLVADHPSVRDIVADGYADRFFKTPLLAAGQSLSLDDIEHGILRRDRPGARFTALRVRELEPRIHVALNCAAASCPPLQVRAFRAEQLEEQLQAALMGFARMGLVRSEPNGGIVLSSLLDWFAADWQALGSPIGTLVADLAQQAGSRHARGAARLRGMTIDDLRADESVRFEYDWTVNDADLGR